jgi:hypothetical protein
MLSSTNAARRVRKRRWYHGSPFYAVHHLWRRRGVRRQRTGDAVQSSRSRGEAWTWEREAGYPSLPSGGMGWTRLLGWTVSGLGRRNATSWATIELHGSFFFLFTVIISLSWAFNQCNHLTNKTTLYVSSDDQGTLYWEAVRLVW